MEQIQVKITKDLPKEQIKDFEDKVVHFAAIFTREYTKGMMAYPHLTGELEQQEIKAPVKRVGHAAYTLLDGVDYAKYVWKMTNVNWTNEKTQPQWYKSVYKAREKAIISKAETKALGELK